MRRLPALDSFRSTIVLSPVQTDKFMVVTTYVNHAIAQKRCNSTSQLYDRTPAKGSTNTRTSDHNRNPIILCQFNYQLR